MVFKSRMLSLYVAIFEPTRNQTVGFVSASDVVSGKTKDSAFFQREGRIVLMLGDGAFSTGLSIASNVVSVKVKITNFVVFYLPPSD